VILANSTWRTLLATAFVVGGLVWLYEETILDSRYAVKRGETDPQPPPKPGSRLSFSATAYCKGSTTASGVNVRSGIAAADPDLLPVGSVVQVDAPGARYDGVYTVMDTGPKVQGRHVDLYMWSCHEALRFGRAAVRLSVLRLGWSPAQSAPGLVDRLFRRREAAAQAAPLTPAVPVGSPVPARDSQPNAPPK
jgi:3D (Asp-Asp-Asp) domain-containing protein